MYIIVICYNKGIPVISIVVTESISNTYLRLMHNKKICTVIPYERAALVSLWN